ncbi:unnamed protein product [Dovyalis caffra]|uniref:Uncharacterized protein n=1 Tax=Dovyalis caffra TaxID=77055 RepID=A0AAV1SY66_9ROSI|nr:unnamed protein product [Dovyalis caffra]
MSHMDYTKVGKRGHHHHHHLHHGASCTRGFRLKYPKRFSVQRLRARFFYLFRFLSRWRSSYGQAVQYVKKGMGRNSSIKRCGSSKRGLMVDATSCHYMGKGSDDQFRFRSFGRSNSFYSEAIADCLEFIKRMMMEEKGISMMMTHDGATFSHFMVTMATSHFMFGLGLVIMESFVNGPYLSNSKMAAHFMDSIWLVTIALSPIMHWASV